MSRELLQQAAHRGSPLSSVTAQLVQLLDDYGAAELEHAIAEALKNDVPHPNSVRQVLERRREQSNRLPPLTLTLHHSEILVIEAESYRMREAKERAARKKKAVKPPRATTKHPAPKQPA